MTITTKAPDVVPGAPLDLAAMARVSEACRTAQKLRTLAALRFMNAQIRAENLQRHLP